MNKFPFKKAAIASLIISLVYLILLCLLYSIVNNVTDQKNLWILFVVWGSAFVVSLIAYWVYQFYQYHRHKN